MCSFCIDGAAFYIDSGFVYTEKCLRFYLVYGICIEVSFIF